MHVAQQRTVAHTKLVHDNSRLGAFDGGVECLRSGRGSKFHSQNGALVS